MKALELSLADADATEHLGRQLAPRLQPGAVVYLEGTLGAGKTTFARGLLMGLGHSGTVKSPTYTLVEPYRLGVGMLYHFDLYRLGDPEELDYMGIRDYFTKTSIALVEWPQCGAGYLASPDLVITLVVTPPSRQARLRAETDNGQKLIEELTNA